MTVKQLCLLLMRVTNIEFIQVKTIIVWPCVSNYSQIIQYDLFQWSITSTDLQTPLIESKLLWWKSRVAPCCSSVCRHSMILIQNVRWQCDRLSNNWSTNLPIPETSVCLSRSLQLITTARCYTWRNMYFVHQVNCTTFYLFFVVQFKTMVWHWQRVVLLCQPAPQLSEEFCSPLHSMG